jgi:hypothetical protein
MKLLSKHTLRGSATGSDGLIKIHLYDGNRKTGFKVVGFQAFPQDFSVSSTGDIIGKLATSNEVSTAAADFFNVDDNREIAWSGGEANTDQWQYQNSIIDPDNLVVEDLYVAFRVSGGNSYKVNYIIYLEKYDIGLSLAAYSMVRNEAQGFGS